MNTELDVVKTDSKKVVYKSVEFLRNKTGGAVANSCDDKIVKQEHIEELIVPPENTEKLSNELNQLL